MKVIHIFSDFPIQALEGSASGRGGGQAATWLPQLAQCWQNSQEFEIHWTIFDRNASQIQSHHCWNQYFHVIPSHSMSTSMLLARWPYRLNVRSQLKKTRPDLIHCWGTENLYSAALCEFDGPSILSMQGILTTYFRTGDLKGWRWRLFRHWEPKSIRKATMVTSESQWGLDRVNEIVPNKRTSRVEYGVHPSYYDIPWKPDSLEPRILFVGGWNRLKGVDILIEMLKRHPNRNWTMVFAGGGYLAEQLHALNDSKVEILGLLKTEQVQQEMSKAWALVMPSRADTSPNVVKEARVIGLPVVGSPHGGHAEYIAHGTDGAIVSSEDPDAWFAAIDQIASNFDQCRHMGDVHRDKFREHFRPENTASQFLELYRQLVNNQA